MLGLVEPIVWCLVLAAGFSAMLWQRTRVQRLLGAGSVDFDDDAEVVAHLARHEAESRGSQVSALHWLYALVQNDIIAQAIRDEGGDVDAIEDKLFVELEADKPTNDLERRVETLNVIAWATYMAGRNQRRPGPADLWGGLVQVAPTTAKIVEASGVGAADVLSRLVHGDLASSPAMSGTSSTAARGEVCVVLINDEVTQQELVVDILHRVFDLNTEDAMTRMLQVHKEGSGVIAKYPATVAADKVKAAHDIARQQGSPLLLRLE